ncbi:MAG: TldD/PmbA family protein [Lachnospiraceae bacterium]|nr:TldD/PmbA family protein [Lachnospiraceae bacterium]
MLEVLEKKLTALCPAAWELTETKETRWEFYFIGHKLDQNRAVKVLDTEVKLYCKSEDGQFLGNASAKIAPTASEAEIEETLNKLRFEASLVKNPVYTLTDTLIEVPAQTEAVDVAAIAGDCIRAIAEVPETEGQKINSYEIFVSELKRTTLNSNGVTYTCTYPSTEMEVVVNAKKDAHEIELHRIYNSGTCDGAKLKHDIARVMQFGADRLVAAPTPKLGSGTVLFSTADAATIYDYFVDNMHADYVVRKISDFTIGEPVAAFEDADRLSIEAVASLPNSSRNFPVDREGNEIYDRFLIRDGVAENYCGSRQFSQYLGLAKSSLVTNYKVSGGAKSEEELRKGDYLEVVEFSDFHVDAMGGDIAGEIRLGYWHHDGQVKIVTGGSVSGSMTEAAKTMHFSKETTQYDCKEIPVVTLLSGLRITGVE